MPALVALVVAFFSCSVIGLGWTTLLGGRRNPQRDLLVSPAVGIAALVIPAFLLSRLGFPVRAFANDLVGVELLAGVVIICILKPRLRWREVAVFAVPVVLGFTLTALPVVEFGFNWLGYANSDIGYYALAAQRYLDHGFASRPSIPDLLFHRDLSAQLYFLDFVSRERIGAQLLLALFAACVHQPPLRLVMPFSLCAFFATISATSGLLAVRNRAWWEPCLCGTMMAASSLGSFWTYLGLLGQCFGLPLLVATFVVAEDLPEITKGSLPAAIRSGSLAAILVAGLALVYPEVAPFLVGGVALFLVAVSARHLLDPRMLGVYVATAVILSVVLLNVYLPAVVAMVGTRSVELVGPQHLFEQYLVPSGLANVWGFTPLFLSDPQPWLSFEIFCGALCLLFAIAGAIWHSWKGFLPGTALLVMLAIALYFFSRSLDFPLFKMAMYVQPVLVACFCMAALSVRNLLAKAGKPRTGVALAVVLVSTTAIAGLHAQRFYVAASSDLPDTVPVGISAIANGSPRHFLDEAERAHSQSGLADILFDNAGLAIVAYAGAFAQGNDFIVPGSPYIDRIVPLDQPQRFHQDAELTQWIERYTTEYGALHRRRYFSLKSKEGPPQTAFLLNETLRGSGGTPQDAKYWLTSPRLSVLNRFRESRDVDDIRVARFNDVHNHLVLMDHSFGVLLPWSRTNVALTEPPEPDGILPGGERMQGFGRYELFEVLHPSKRLRLVFAFSETGRLVGPDSSAQRRIPPVDAIGARRVSMGGEGSGAARLVSPEIEPQWIDGRAFVALDMGRPPRAEQYPKSGLMNLYGRGVALDNTELVGRARDISAISAFEYEHDVPPTSLDSPGAAVGHDNLFFSGMYEDGYVDRTAWFKLGSSRSNAILLLSGSVPEGRRGVVRIDASVDGRRVLEGLRPSGPFVLDVPVNVPRGPHRVDVTADRVFRRPWPDTRIVSFQIARLGFYRDVDLTSLLDIYDMHKPIELGRGWYSYETYAGKSFRWVSNDAEVRLGPSNRSLMLQLDAEPGPGVGYRAFPMAFRLGGRKIGEAIVSGAPVRFRIPAHAQTETLVLQVVGGGQRIAADPRILNFRVMRLTLGQKVVDIPMPESVEFGADWYPLERYNGEQFHWAGQDATLTVADRIPSLRLTLEPGPAIAGGVMQLEVEEPDGSREQLAITGRREISVPVRGTGALRFHVLNGGGKVASDPRTLDFRVFAIAGPVRSRPR